ncbi:MAG TPA: mannose-1-phosphate guanylyltransferase [Candidatus Kryptonia bacterium]|nr:mannose-1-phosphate guanylyltransferase [Candidatus Kryptonia bacterium]
MAQAAVPPRYAVIMAGGSGTRFWPWSRRALPKQLLPIVSRRSMLQETAARLRSLVPPERIVIVTGGEHAAAVRRQLPNVPRRNILTEPVGRNTAPCVAVAAEWIHRRAPESSMVVLPADHAIGNVPAFRSTLRRAFAIAEGEGALVTLGVRPAHAETGYGYIKVGALLDRGRHAASRVARFCEKPAAVMARRFVASGRYLWNAGIFVWQTAAIRSALARHAPEIARRVQRTRTIGPVIPASLYRRMPSVAIDVAVMEPASQSRNGSPVAVVTADFGWSDVGSWAALPALWGHDRAGNAVRGNAVLIDSENATVVGGRRVIAVLGVRDLVVVDTPDALLICRSSRAQDVRRVVTELERRGQRAAL